MARVGRGDVCLLGFGRGTEERDHFEDLCINGRIILRCILKKWTGEAWTGLIWLEIETACGLL